jgi:hypothetical protein
MTTKSRQVTQTRQERQCNVIGQKKMSRPKSTPSHANYEDLAIFTELAKVTKATNLDSAVKTGLFVYSTD